MDREKLNRFHIALMVFNTQSGIILFTLPRITAHYMGTNGWLMLIPMFLLVTLNIMLISAVYRMGGGNPSLRFLVLRCRGSFWFRCICCYGDCSA